jgi:hypothetical protein
LRLKDEQLGVLIILNLALPWFYKKKNHQEYELNNAKTNKKDNAYSGIIEKTMLLGK